MGWNCIRACNGPGIRAQQTRGDKGSSDNNAGSSEPDRAIAGLARNTGHRQRVARTCCSLVCFFKGRFDRFASHGWSFAEREGSE